MSRLRSQEGAETFGVRAGALHPLLKAARGGLCFRRHSYRTSVFYRSQRHCQASFTGACIISLSCAGSMVYSSPPMPLNARERVRLRIKRLLEERGKTQRLFARALEHGDQWASNFLRGEFALSLDQLDTAAAFLGVPPSELVRKRKLPSDRLSPFSA